MKRKRANGKPKPKKPSVVGEDEPFNTTNQSGLNDFNSGQAESRMEARTQQNNTYKGGPRAGLEERGAVNDGVEDYANSLSDTVTSSPCKVTRGMSTRSSRRMGSSITNLAACAILLQNGRTLQKEANTPQQDPRYKEQELKAALAVINKVMQMNAAEPFNVPVDPIALGIPDYFDVIDTPMDFGTIRSNLEKGIKYLNSKDVFEDVQYIWENCAKYNTKGQYILGLMKQVKKNFTKYWTAAGLYSEPPGGINGPLHLPAMESATRGSKRGFNSPVGPMTDNPGQLQQDQMGLSPLEMHQPSLSYNQIRPPQQKPCQCQSSCVQPQPSRLEADIDISNAGNPHLPAPMESPMRRRTRGRRSPVGTMTDGPVPQKNKMGPSEPQLRQALASYKQSCQPHQRSFKCHPGSTLSQPSQPQAGSNISCADMAPGRRHITQPTQLTQSESVLPAMSNDTNPLSCSVASTSTRKGRGRAKNIALQKALAANGGQRIKIVISPGLKEPVGKWDKIFKAEVGIIVKMNPPVAASSSDEVPEQVVRAWHTRILHSFDIDLLDPHTKKSVNSYCMKRFRGFRYDLHKHYKETENPRSHPPVGVSSEEWQLCCTRFESVEFKALSVQNSASRAQLTVGHSCGSKSFAQYRHELTESQSQDSQGPVSLILLYKKTHYNDKTGQWSSSEAKENYEAMERIRAEPTPERSTPPTDEEIYERVLGRRPGYFRGLGHGVEPISSRSSSHLTCEARVREANERADQALREAAETRAALEVSLQEQRQQNAEVRSLIESLRRQKGSSS